MIKPTEDSKTPLSLLTLGALGVVFGDIGTSPLYALKECFHTAHGNTISSATVMGVTSLILWSLIIIVTLKYLFVVLYADNQGEGGILALMALARLRIEQGKETKRQFIVMVGLCGAALLYGDGVITPAISVLSAVEGLGVVAPGLESLVIPITIAILFAVFYLQSQGTAKIGIIFGPIIALWFVVIGGLGLYQIVQHSEILASFNPLYAVQFLSEGGTTALLTLGAVFLAVTGAEALYADMGHFGRMPIKLGWCMLVFPGLVLNYLGQAALLISQPSAIESPFFLLAPEWFQIPLICLATAATVIASQALISGAFSLTRQAIQLNYLPRMQILHTSSREIGQIYIPVINSLLFLTTVALVIGFKSSTNMAAAYGIAVSLTMLLTSILLFFVMCDQWRWPLWKALAVIGVFFSIELGFFIANASKFFSGGWVSILLGVGMFTVMSTWRKGRRIVARRLKAQSIVLEKFFAAISEDPPHRVAGTAVFMSRNPDGVPPPLLHNLRHNKVLHERVVILTILNERVPYVGVEDRISVEGLGMGFYRVLMHFGFMERPDLKRDLVLTQRSGLEIDISQTTFFLGAEILIPRRNEAGMAYWREKLFALLARNAQKVPLFYDIPPSQVVEVGLQVEL